MQPEIFGLPFFAYFAKAFMYFAAPEIGVEDVERDDRAALGAFLELEEVVGGPLGAALPLQSLLGWDGQG